MPISQTVAPENIAAASLARSLAEEVRKLHKLGMDCRAASFASFLNSARRPAIATPPFRPVEPNASRPDS